MPSTSYQSILAQRNTALLQAQQLVLTAWYQGAFGQDWDGKEVEDQDEVAEHCVCFCLAGAIVKATAAAPAMLERECMKACERALVDLGYVPSIPAYNDTEGRSKYEVAALVDHATRLPLQIMSGDNQP